jgi:hypothetical protein
MAVIKFKAILISFNNLMHSETTLFCIFKLKLKYAATAYF